MQNNFVPRYTKDQAPSAKEEVLGALVTMCLNNVLYLKEAKRIQELRRKQPEQTKRGPPLWKAAARDLMKKIWLELEETDPEFTAAHWSSYPPKAEAFLEALP
jgi:hypothetical protein